MDKPQIILHIQKTVNYTLFDTKWIPSSAKFVVLGTYAKGSGALQIYEVSHGEVNCILNVSRPFRRHMVQAHGLHCKGKDNF